MRRLLGSASTAIDFQIEVRRLDYRRGALLWGLDDPVLALLVAVFLRHECAQCADAAGANLKQPEVLSPPFLS
ncbi:hypothetical protein ACWC9T_39930 [Kitasatospora sp. NPDC001159]